MKIKELMEKIELKFPKRNAEDWDNVGLIIGDEEEEIKGIVLTLDVDRSSIEKAIESKSNLIISHHPQIFKGIKKIVCNSSQGEKIKEIIKNDISVYSLHTNLDSTIGGLTDRILEKLDVTNGKILSENLDKTAGIGRYYKLKTVMVLRDYIEFIKKRLKIEEVIFYGDINKEVKKVAIINGSGGEYWRQAKLKGCDLVVTGDVTYHCAKDALEEGVNILDLGHYESEKFFLEQLKEILEEIKEKKSLKVIIAVNTGEIRKIV